MPILSRSRPTLVRSSTRMTTLSPNMVGSTLTRMSTGLPPTFSSMRPSCGSRRSAMSRFDMTLMRLSDGGGEVPRRRDHLVQHAVARGSASCTRPRTARSGCPRRGPGCAISSTMLMSLRTGAELAISSTVVEVDRRLAAARSRRRCRSASSCAIRSVIDSSFVGRVRLGEQRLDLLGRGEDRASTWRMPRKFRRSSRACRLFGSDMATVRVSFSNVSGTHLVQLGHVLRDDLDAPPASAWRPPGWRRACRGLRPSPGAAGPR